MSTKLNVKLITDNLADELIARVHTASGIYIMTSFIMESGVKLLAPHPKQADGVFSLNIQVHDDAERHLLYQWTQDICLYRLHAYFERGVKE